MTAISSIGVLGIFLAGWGSNNKYSVVSAMRGAVQMISYEMSLGLCLISAVAITGTMQMSGIVEAQTGPWKWLVVQGHIPAILAFLVFLVAGNAEANRGPFDLAEAESELTAGYHTEYSSILCGVVAHVGQVDLSSSACRPDIKAGVEVSHAPDALCVGSHYCLCSIGLDFIID